MNADAKLPQAPAVFVGMQDCAGFMPDFALFNLTIDVPGHPAGSTVSEQTLQKLGFAVPERRAAA